MKNGTSWDLIHALAHNWHKVRRCNVELCTGQLQFVRRNWMTNFLRCDTCGGEVQVARYITDHPKVSSLP